MFYGLLLLLIAGLVAAEFGLISELAAAAVDGFGLLFLLVVFVGWLKDRFRSRSGRARV